MYTNIGSGDYVHVLQGASISDKKSSIGLNSGKLCLSDNATLSGNGKTGKDSIWKDSGASILLNTLRIDLNYFNNTFVI